MPAVKLGKAFYRQREVTQVARELLGLVLVCRSGRRTTSGVIVETEAYSWRERGCHAFGNRMTARNASMFGAGGICYVYRCYGIHHLLNLVTGEKGMGEAVLIRALEPLDGLKWMEERHGRTGRITNGPGKLTKAMGITTGLDGADLVAGPVWVEDRRLPRPEIGEGPRIGIDYAGDDAALPWRFWIRGNPWVSR